MEEIINHYYFQIFAKLMVTLVLLLIYTRISGMRQLSPTTAFDNIGNMVVGAVAGTTLLNRNIRIIDSTFFMALWLVVLFLVRFLKPRVRWVKKLLSGYPIVLMIDGKMQPEGFDKAKASLKDIESLLRAEGVSGFSDLEDLLVEANGKLSYQLKNSDQLAYILIDSGELRPSALELIDKDESWIKAELKRANLKLEEVFCGEFVNNRLEFFTY